jgi:hypothetical protein
LRTESSCCVRWYLRYSLSYLDLCNRMARRSYDPTAPEATSITSAGAIPAHGLEGLLKYYGRSA